MKAELAERAEAPEVMAKKAKKELCAMRWMGVG